MGGISPAAGPQNITALKNNGLGLKPGGFHVLLFSFFFRPASAHTSQLIIPLKTKWMGMFGSYSMWIYLQSVFVKKNKEFLTKCKNIFDLKENLVLQCDYKPLTLSSFCRSESEDLDKYRYDTR